MLAAAGIMSASPMAIAAPAAATATAQFNVTATVNATCLISANNLPFGTYTGVIDDANTTLSVTCTNTTPYNVGLNAGTGTGATTTSRSMTGPGGALLGYKLFQDAGYTTNWGNAVGTDTVAGTGNGAAQTLTVYGQVPAAEYVTPGGYSDTITATITY